jgi:hypothetical protein
MNVRLCGVVVTPMESAYETAPPPPPPNKTNNVFNSTALDTSDTVILYHNINLMLRYCHVIWSNCRRGFGLDIGFIDHLEVVTTNNNNTISIYTLFKITLNLFQTAVSSIVVAW